MVYLPPDSHVLFSYANANLPWWKALAELIDNSIDAGATRVVVDITNRVLTVSDDGRGCQDVETVFQLGKHARSSKSGGLGRYGIGAKDAWLSCADIMEVVTVRNGVQTSMRVDYLQWAESNWNAPDPVSIPCSAPSGTLIRLPLRNGKNTPTDDAFKMLRFVFTPAIQRGIQIVESRNGRRKALSPVEMPARDDVVQAEFEIDGKHVKIDIGILPEGVSLERGPFWLIYDHRIIDFCSIGGGDYSVRRMAGTIVIGEGWAITKNKDDLSENRDRLESEIFSRVEHVLKKAEQLAETIESTALRGALQELLNTAVADANKKLAREKRNKGQTSGSVEPVFSGRKRQTAKQTQDKPGSVIVGGNGNEKKGSFKLDWCDLDPTVLGRFDRAGMRVSLNTQNGFIASCKADSNLAALTACAFSLIADYECRHDKKGNQLLRYSFEDFSQAIGGLLKDCNGERPKC